MSIQRVDTLPTLPPREPDAHKGSYGRILVIAGSRGMSGAAALCACGALRGGAGLVRIAVPASVLPVVAAINPCYMVAEMPEDKQGRFATEANPVLLKLAHELSVVVAGPGLGHAPSLAGLVRALVTQCEQPLVLDADALNALDGQLDLLRERKAPLILTPHPREFGRLIGFNASVVQSDRQGHALRFAESHGGVLVLKGHETIVTDGQRIYINTTGNPGMATGGTGDVLAGLIGALLGQGLTAFEAAQLGVFLHGKAGDLAAAELGQVSMIATDLLDYLPLAFRSLTEPEAPKSRSERKNSHKKHKN